jgi:hypothetical protein
VTPFSYIESKVLVRVQPSKISGVGVFALKDIPTSTSLFEPWLGETGVYAIPESKLITLPKLLYRHIKDIFLYGPDFPSNTDTYITLTNGCHWVYTTPYYFVNSGFSNANMDKDTMKSTKFIPEGKEILSNYGRYERFDSKQLI